VKAPFPGIITHRNVDTGAFVNSAGSGRGEPLFTLARVDKLIVILRLPEKEAGMVRQGCKAHMTITALDGLVVEGTVSRFSRVLDDKSRTMRVEIDIDNKSGTVYPGMYGPVKVVLREMPDALTVPAGAVYAVGGKTFVVQVRGGKAYRIPVVTAYDDGLIVQIESGLKGNEEIVVSNKGQLAEGQPVDPHRVDNANANGSLTKRK
jgi:RND family efflux transporter MFP subunit